MAIWNLTHYCGINAIQPLVSHFPWQGPKSLTIQWPFILVFDVVPSTLLIVAVHLLVAHNVLNEPRYLSSSLIGP
jgi:hypothetical protein